MTRMPLIPWRALTTPMLVTCLYCSVFLAALSMHRMPAPIVVISFGLAIPLIALTVIDLGNGTLPDRITLPLVLAGIAISWWLMLDSIAWRLISAGLAGAFIVAANIAYRALRKVDGIGYGDAKLLMAAGAWLGLSAIPSVLLCASASGLSFLLVRGLRGEHLTPHSALAFGPHLAFGTWLVWLFGAIG